MNTATVDGNPWGTRLTLLTLAHVMGTVGYVSVMAMAPEIRRDLDLNATQVGSFMLAFYFALALSALPAGTLVDRLGVGWALSTSMALLALGAAGFGCRRGRGGGFLAPDLVDDCRSDGGSCRCLVAVGETAQG